MRRGRDPSRTPSRPRRPVWDNPRGQLPGTGIRSDGGNLYGGNYGASTQGVSGTSSGGVAVTGDSSSGGRSLLSECFREWLWRGLFWWTGECLCW